ncbi:uncharacterized protein LY89DRAFT_596299 [Mollisia scopiformis]|uniref:Acyltransferase 3 domain-containing protein n=1 Tax=Mollisia scopiformis TaxID=149040 RepID=A0A132BDM5_MOLSC|nr:uncharacterized protein LY89DRAFT_596299 [Mollisia scopiformis]KUJ10506.1 hypothetical protein LY89DRAFT_596299 [Mollisia scopiformis]
MDDEKSFNLLSQEEIYSFTPILPHRHRRSWRKTPLTTRGLFTLLLKPLLPSFIFTSPPVPLHSTSYLDGLRGIAALIVYMDHFVLNWFYPLRNGYLSSPTDTSILQLPIIRLLFAGRASVGVFFVISGFVLSHKPLSQLRSGNRSAVLQTLSSSVFRRSMRLFLPILFGTFISMNLAYNGYFTPVPSRGELIPPILPSYKAQVKHWWFYFLEIAFPFWDRGVDPNRAYGSPYNGHLWTIPIEFYGSMVVFLTVVAGSGARGEKTRMAGTMGLAGWSLRRGRWDVFSFLGGMVLAEWSLIRAGEGERERLLSHHEDADMNLQPRVKVLLKVLNGLLLLLALFLLSYAGESPSPGFYHAFLIPCTPALWEPIFLGREHYWLTLGSLLLVFTLTNSPTLQRPFTTSFAQYLGRISYSLYIIHGMVLFTIGTYMQERYTGQVGEDKWVDNGFGELVEAVVRVEKVGFEPGSWGFVRAWAAAGIVCTVVVFWATDLFWRGVDRGCVAGARWVEGVFVGRGRS